MSAVLFCLLQQAQRDPDARMTRAMELIKATIPHPINAHSNPSHVSPINQNQHC